MSRSLLLIPLAFLGACQLSVSSPPPLPPLAVATPPTTPAGQTSPSEPSAVRETSTTPDPSMATKGWSASQIEAMKQGEPASSDPAMMKEPASTMKSGTSEGVSYVPFNQADYAANLGKKPMVLFFHATWCPVCRALAQTIAMGRDRLRGGIPIYIVDYDTESALKQQYDVRIQHTLVAIGADGKVRTITVGATALAEVQRLIDAAKG